MCRVVQKTIPYYKKNPYLKEVLSEIDQLQIALIDQNISREEFVQVIHLLQGKILEEK